MLCFVHAEKENPIGPYRTTLRAPEVVPVGRQYVVGHSVANERRHHLPARPVVEARRIALEAMPAKNRSFASIVTGGN